MKYLHTMVRVNDIDESLDFYCNKLGLSQLRRYDNEQARFSLVFLAAPGDDEAQVELTYNWDGDELVPEEAFFRGYLQSSLDGAWKDRRWRILGAEIGPGWLLAAFIFAVGHVLTIPNLGNAIAHDVNIVDTLPPELTFYAGYTPVAQINGIGVAGFVGVPLGAPGGPCPARHPWR